MQYQVTSCNSGRLRPVSLQLYHSIVCNWSHDAAVWCSSVLQQNSTNVATIGQEDLFQALDRYVRKTIVGVVGINIVMAAIALRYLLWVSIF